MSFFIKLISRSTVRLTLDCYGLLGRHERDAQACQRRLLEAFELYERNQQTTLTSQNVTLLSAVVATGGTTTAAPSTTPTSATTTSTTTAGR